jgi:hypothetical protein
VIFAAVLSQQDGEAGGSLTREVPGKVASGPDKAGTCQHHQMVRVRQISSSSMVWAGQ